LLEEEIVEFVLLAFKLPAYGVNDEGLTSMTIMMDLGF
jgi:hypothetical protein